MTFVHSFCLELGFSVEIRSCRLLSEVWKRLRAAVEMQNHMNNQPEREMEPLYWMLDIAILGILLIYTSLFKFHVSCKQISVVF